MHTQHQPRKLKFHSSEKWIKLPGYRGADGQMYAVSNFGRVISYWKNFNYGYFLKHGLMGDKYPCISLRKKGKGYTYLIHRLVANYFVPRPSAKHAYIVHKDYDNLNNHYKNLKWVTVMELPVHKRNDPKWKTRPHKGIGHKLTEAKVQTIKRQLASGKSTLKQIADRFGISDMQVYRIKAGVNWGYVKI